MCFSIAEGLIRLRGGRGARDTIPSSGESGFQMEPGWKTSPSLAEARPRTRQVHPGLSADCRPKGSAVLQGAKQIQSAKQS